ncbi:MAG: hypothetical protein LBP59_06120 [Planctomycetaceae bacterium]|jgi:ABC-type transport system involved in multi-copper enzyme maturation permease subunit|nr:hypothetical protein [Planctomycetaceae bacterium]
MVIEHNIPNFIDWIVPATQGWFETVAIWAGAVFAVSVLLCLIRYGVSGAYIPFVNASQRAMTNLTSFSILRTWAISRLTIMESLRGRVVYVLVLFLGLLLFAGWFLDPRVEDPAKYYLAFVLFTTMILVMLMSLFLSSFSLPTDIKNKTIYAVVTKPVSSSEIVFGRIIGVSIIGTIILVLMGIASYFFVISELQHTHVLTEQSDLTPVSLNPDSNENDPKRVIMRGKTRVTNGHRHEVEILADGTIDVSVVNGHNHAITTKKSDTFTRYIVGTARGSLQARIPVYGELSFRDGDGNDKKKGINVGHEWEYRSYIGGRTNESTANEESAIFLFSDLKQSMFPQSKEQFQYGLPIEMTVGVFRTVKANIEKPVYASLSVRNPKTGLTVEVMTFGTEESITKSLIIPWNINGTPQIIQRKGREEGQYYEIPNTENVIAQRNNPTLNARRQFEFFEDFVADGQVEIWLKCIDRHQYIGIAQADLYVRADNASVGFNFFKGFYAIWMRMIIVTAFGVLFSTFLSGPIAMLSTIGIIIAGFSKGFLMQIGIGNILGGGPFESLYRLMLQQNMVTDLPVENYSTTFIKSADFIYERIFLYPIGRAIPPLSDYGIYDQALVSGFDITSTWLLNHTIMTFAYAVPIFFVAYLILSNRELAK